MACVCLHTASGEKLICIFITLFDIINFIFDMCVGVCACVCVSVRLHLVLIDVYYASSQHKLLLKIKGKRGFSRTLLELVCA